MFAITQNKGFHITFENNWTVSVQFGGGNYCDNYDERYGNPAKPSKTAEVAAWGPDGEFFEIEEGCHVMGYQTANDVALIIDMISKK